MNPISGIFRIPAGDGDGAPDLQSQLLDFLADEKETYELFMVVDEELKMMRELCDRGRPGARAVPQADVPPGAHRDLLAGRMIRDPRDVLATRCTPPRSPARRWRTPAG